MDKWKCKVHTSTIIHYAAMPKQILSIYKYTDVVYICCLLQDVVVELWTDCGGL